MTERQASEVLDLLGDEYARAIVEAISDTPMSAKQLTEELDASQPTISRRLRALEELDLVTEETHLDPHGHHYSVFRSSIDEIDVRLEGGKLVVDVQGPVTPADRMSYIFREMRRD